MGGLTSLQLLRLSNLWAGLCALWDADELALGDDLPSMALSRSSSSHAFFRIQRASSA